MIAFVLYHHPSLVLSLRYITEDTWRRQWARSGKGGWRGVSPVTKGARQKHPERPAWIETSALRELARSLGVKTKGRARSFKRKREELAQALGMHFAAREREKKRARAEGSASDGSAAAGPPSPQLPRARTTPERSCRERGPGAGGRGLSLSACVVCRSDFRTPAGLSAHLVESPGCQC